LAPQDDKKSTFAVASANLCVFAKIPLNQRTVVRFMRGVFKRLDIQTFHLSFLFHFKHFVFNEIADNKTNQTQQQSAQNRPPETMDSKSLDCGRSNVEHKTINNKSKQSQR